MSIDFVFRGQKRSYRSLTISLERNVQNKSPSQDLNLAYQLGYSELPQIESLIFREFRQSVHHHAVSPPENDLLQWLAMMQHHGAPTRLLDVTRSLFVAMYFATGHDDLVDGVIYSFYDLDCLHIYV
jgi:hypothetical protein